MLFYSAYTKRADDSCGFYRMYFGAAAELGAEFVVFHGDSTRAPFIGMDRYAEVFARLAETARSEGVTLAHENVSSARGGDPEFMRELRNRIGAGEISFVFDVKQALRAGHTPEEMIDVMGSDIKHVHINDWAFSNDGSREGGCRLPGAGGLDLQAVIGRIESYGYAGRYMIEVYRKNFVEDSELRFASLKVRSKSDECRRIYWWQTRSYRFCQRAPRLPSKFTFSLFTLTSSLKNSGCNASGELATRTGIEPMISP